jgi:hypothetical protein
VINPDKHSNTNVDASIRHADQTGYRVFAPVKGAIGKLFDCLRLASFERNNRQRSKSGRDESPAPDASKRRHEPIIPPVPADVLVHETMALPTEQTLVVSDTYTVFHAGAAQIPNTIREIGRLREVTFREENEGKGKTIDLDEFDLHYVHLFLRNGETSEIVGAYRLGRTDEILRRFGKRGLYTSTLFDYDTHNICGPAIDFAVLQEAGDKAPHQVCCSILCRKGPPLHPNATFFRKVKIVPPPQVAFQSASASMRLARERMFASPRPAIPPLFASNPQPLSSSSISR